MEHNFFSFFYINYSILPFDNVIIGPLMSSHSIQDSFIIHDEQSPQVKCTR